MPTRFGVAAMGSGPSRTWIVNENCEGTGTPSGWTNALGSPNWDYSAAPLADSQSLYLSIVASTGSVRFDYTDIAEVWIYFLLKLTNGSAPAGTRQIGGNSANGAAVAQTFSIAATLRPLFGTASPANALVIDTMYHVWLHYLQGTGANAVTDIGFSTTGVRPTSGGNYAQVTNGGGTNLSGRLSLGTGATNVNVDVVYDNIRVASTQIGDSGS